MSSFSAAVPVTGIALMAAIRAADDGVSAVCWMSAASTRSKWPGAAGKGACCQKSSIEAGMYASQAVTSAMVSASSTHSVAWVARPRPIAPRRRAAFSGVIAAAAMVPASMAALIAVASWRSSPPVAMW
ncbi:hypothetical protein G4G28_13360 [Massilia sp. Dwa41.01b]|uniref:hypothetical protein n=1 Tax=Massilia sp. Dwa41.01b TaxID=2709302 RepID=UPI00160282A2|nr:hypothetical protein [Massilia sp. Dwa41.01b]QNA89205.1 hypothetical protein G4G28_13360 [Massilia sp. Dwa41.01b]